MSTTMFRRAGATLAAAAASAAIVAIPTQAQAAVPAGEEVSSAANFLATSITANTDHLLTPPSEWGQFPDVGNTVDAILALDAAKAGGDATAAAVAWVQGQAPGYVAWDGKTYAGGGLGKLATLADAQGVDPHDFGGVDLTAQLHALLTDTGRFGGSDNDYDVTINQAWAVLGLARTEGTAPTAAVDYLVAQQCADGGFRGSLEVEPCVSEVDATAFAVQALIAAGDSAHGAKGLDALAARQLADGSFTNASGEGANTNSSAVAAQAFIAGGRTAAADRALAFILGLQWDCAAAEANRGGIHFTAASVAETPENVGYAWRSTSQSLLPLAGGSLVDVSHTTQAPGTVPMTCVVATTPPVTTQPDPTTPPASEPAAAPVAQPVTSVAAATRTARLADTGADTAAPVALGTAMVAVGTLLLLARRRGQRS